MKLNCWCCLDKLNGTCKITRKEKRFCKEYYKRNKIKTKETMITLDLDTIEINKENKEFKSKNKK